MEGFTIIDSSHLLTWAMHHSPLLRLLAPLKVPLLRDFWGTRLDFRSRHRPQLRDFRVLLARAAPRLRGGPGEGFPRRGRVPVAIITVVICHCHCCTMWSCFPL